MADLECNFRIPVIQDHNPQSLPSVAVEFLTFRMTGKSGKRKPLLKIKFKRSNQTKLTL
jgi:hypothetical protein